MPQLQASFERDPAWEEPMLEETDMVNMGGGWLELNKGEITLEFLDAWWDLGESYKGGSYLRKRLYHDQRVLNALLAARPGLRAQTALLEDTVFNSPTSACVPHLYYNLKSMGDVRRAMATDLLERLELADNIGREIVIHVGSDELVARPVRREGPLTLGSIMALVDEGGGDFSKVGGTVSISFNGKAVFSGNVSELDIETLHAQESRVFIFFLVETQTPRT